jgi:hypothetical protein
MRTEVERAVVRDTAERIAALADAREDVLSAGRVHSLDTAEAEEFGVDVTLEPAS